MGGGADGRRLHDEPAVQDDGPADHPRIGLHPGRSRLPGHRAHVDGGAPLDHQPVGRDRLSGPYHEALLFLEFLCGKDHFTAVGQEHRDILGAQRRQCPQRTTGLRLGPCLEVTAGQHEHRHPGGDLQVDGVAVRQCLPHTAGLPGRVREEDRRQRPQRRRDDPYRDQGLHGGHPVPGVTQRHPMERPGRPGDDRQCQGGEQPMPADETGRRQHREHHRQMRQRNEEHGRHRKPDQERPRGGVVRVGTLVGLPVALLGLVAGPLHDVAQLLGRHRIRGVDGGDPGGVIHRRPHSVEFVQPGLNPGRARRTRHPRHVEFDAPDRWRIGPAGDGGGHRPPPCTGGLAPLPSRKESARTSRKFHSVTAKIPAVPRRRFAGSSDHLG